MATRSLFSKAPDPPEAAGPNRASDSGRGGVRGVRRSAKRVAPDPEEVVSGGGSHSSLTLGVLGDLKKQTPTSESPTALKFYWGAFS